MIYTIYHFHDPLAYILMLVQCSYFNGIISPSFHTQNDKIDTRTFARSAIYYLEFSQGITYLYVIQMVNQKTKLL